MNVIKPTKDQVRLYIAERIASRTPPQDPADIRRQLGWMLSPQNVTTTTQSEDPTR